MASQLTAHVLKSVDRAKTFDDIYSIFTTFFVTPEELDKAPLHVEVEEGKVTAKGTDTEVYYPGGSDSGRFELWELDDVIPSHLPSGGLLFTINPKYPVNVQERQYHKDENEAMKVINNARSFNPKFLVTDNPDSVNGPPVIAKNGVVLGGNSRTMSLMVAYKQHTDKIAAYKNILKERSDVFGLKPGDIDAFEKPILVRVVSTSFSDEDMAKMSRNYNQSFTQGMDEIAEGVSRAKFVSQLTLDIFTEAMDNGQFSTIREFLANKSASSNFIAALKKDGVIEESKMSVYFDKNKDLNDSGKKLVEATLRGVVIPKFEILSAVPKSIIDKIDKSIASLSYIKNADKRWDLSDKLEGALKLCIEFQKRKADGKVNINNFLNTISGDMLSAITGGAQKSEVSELNELRKDPVVRDLFMLFQRCSQKSIISVMETYVATVKKFPKGQFIFNQVSEPDPKKVIHELIGDALTKAHAGDKRVLKNGSITCTTLYGYAKTEEYGNAYLSDHANLEKALAYAGAEAATSKKPCLVFARDGASLSYQIITEKDFGRLDGSENSMFYMVYPEGMVYNVVYKETTKKSSAKQTGLFESSWIPQVFESTDPMSVIDEHIKKIDNINDLTSYISLLFERGSSPKTIYQRLLGGEFNLQRPMPFLATLERAFREIGKELGKIKPPFKTWINMHEDWII